MATRMAHRIQWSSPGGSVPDNRRTQHRHTVSLAAKLTINGTPNDCTMLNLSLGGALLAAQSKHPLGQRVELAFTVRWSNTDGVGVQFDGLRARDVWALNEYFKQLSP